MFLGNDHMSLRAMRGYDMVDLKMIHHKFYREEFEFPDFQEKFLNAFVIEKDGEIITAGGVRIIAEAVALTDLSFDRRIRKEALQELLEGCAYTAGREGFDQLHAFIQDHSWKQVLINRRFKPTKGEALVFQLGER